MISDYDGEYFKNILKELKTKTHPEKTHRKIGNHPGSKWYLKTVCPNNQLPILDKFGYGSLWANISNENPTIVRIIPKAYDWDGTEIPYMMSVWIDKDYDIILNYNSNRTGLEVIMVDRHSGNEYYIENLKCLIDVMSETNKWKNKPVISKKDSEELQNLYEDMKNDLSKTDKKIECEYKIIYGGKIEDGESDSIDE